MSFGCSDPAQVLALTGAIYSALRCIEYSKSRVDELVTFLGDPGCRRSFQIKQLIDLETQNIQHIQALKDTGSTTDLLPKCYFSTLFGREPAHTKWIQTSNYLPELKILAAELHSLYIVVDALDECKDDEAGALVDSVMDCPSDEKEVETTRLESQLKMVVWYCEDFCARVDKFMEYREFKPLRWPPAPIHANVIQKETPFLLENVAIERHDRTLDPSGQELTQRLCTFLDRIRAILPDEDLPHQVCDLSDGLFLLFGTVMCPWLVWVSILSLNPESASALDKSFLKWSPFAATSVAGLDTLHIVAVTTVASSVTISTCASALPVWRACSRGRLSALVSCWLFIPFGALLWLRIGGSIDTLFLVFMPFAMGVGVASGLLWHKQMSNAQ